MLRIKGRERQRFVVNLRGSSHTLMRVRWKAFQLKWDLAIPFLLNFEACTSNHEYVIRSSARNCSKTLHVMNWRGNTPCIGFTVIFASNYIFKQFTTSNSVLTKDTGHKLDLNLSPIKQRNYRDRFTCFNRILIHVSCQSSSSPLS